MFFSNNMLFLSLVLYNIVINNLHAELSIKGMRLFFSEKERQMIDNPPVLKNFALPTKNHADPSTISPQATKELDYLGRLFSGDKTSAFWKYKYNNNTTYFFTKADGVRQKKSPQSTKRDGVHIRYTFKDGWVEEESVMQIRTKYTGGTSKITSNRCGRLSDVTDGYPGCFANDYQLSE